MTSVAIVSLFRDRAGMVPRYIRQIESLELDERPHVVCIEGDSVDNTGELLDVWSETNDRVHVVHRDLGLPLYGSTVNPERFLILSTVANIGLDYVATNLKVDFVMFLEMDVHYEPDLVKKLLVARRSLKEERAIVAPMVWIDLKHKGTVFYDSWAFRQLPVPLKPLDTRGVFGGKHYPGNARPWLPKEHFHRRFRGRLEPVLTGRPTNFPTNNKQWFRDNCPVSPYKIYSAGTVLLADSELVPAGARFPSEDVIVGYCNSAKNLGAEIYVDPDIHVQHPLLGALT